MPIDSHLPEGAEAASAAGFNHFIGPLYRLPDAGGATRFCFVAANRHMNAAGSVHGGMLMALADIAMSRTARLSSGAGSCSTISLNCDFAGPARLGELVEARIRVTRRTRTMVFLSGEIVAADRLAMTAAGLWRIFAADA